MSPKITGTVWQYGYWITPSLKNSLNKFVSGDKSWGVLTWQESFPGDEKGRIKVDILKASDNSILVSGLTWQEEGIDLSEYGDISETEDIKLKFHIWKKSESPVISKIGLRFKQDW